MPAVKVACPHCGAGLTFGATPTPGTKVMCPRCNTIITLNGSCAPDTPASRTTPALPARSPETSDANSFPWLMLASAGAGFLLLVGVSAGLVTFFLASGRESHFVTPPGAMVKPDTSQDSVDQTAKTDPAFASRRMPGPGDPHRPPIDPSRPNPPGDPFRPGPFDPPGNLGPNPAAALTALPEAEQRKVDQAIEKGVSYLRAAQAPTGGWFGS